MYTKKEKKLISQFNFEKKKRILKQTRNLRLKKISNAFLKEGSKIKYEYNFSFAGIPIIQYPQDITAIQELIWKVKPDLIIETGVAHGGSAVLSAAFLRLLDFEETKKNKIKRNVIAIDIDIRPHNLKRLKKLNLSKYIKFYTGSSIDPFLFKKIKKIAKKYKKIFVILDSDHTKDHVYQELQLYGQLVSKNSYIVVFDTGLNFWGAKKIKGRKFSKSNNPYQAVKKFIKTNKNFKVDKSVDNKLMITSCVGGFLRKFK
jgi:cephalosporin hydroxylase